MAKITDRTYNAITNRIRKYMEKELPFLDGDEVGWYEDVDNLERTGRYSWRAYNPQDGKSYLLTCDWIKKTVTHSVSLGDAWKRY